MGSITVQILAPSLMADCIHARLQEHSQPAVSSDLPEVTLLAGRDWAVRLEEQLEQSPPPPISSLLLLTEQPEEDIVIACSRGIDVYVGWSDTGEMLLHGLRAAAAGEPYCSPDLSRHVVRALREELLLPAPLRQRAPASLSCREREVAYHAVQGLSNKEISRHLNVSVSTVKFHLGHAFGKLGVCRRNELVAICGSMEVSAALSHSILSLP